MKLSELQTAYLTHVKHGGHHRKTTFITYQNRLRYFGQWLAGQNTPDPDIADLNAATFVRYNAFLLARNLRPKTRRGCFHPLRELFRFAIENRICTNNPAEAVRLPEPDRPRRYKPTDEEVAALFDACDRQPTERQARLCRAVLSVLSLAMLRSQCECCALRIGDYYRDGEQAFIRTRDGKGGNDRTRPISPHVAEALDRWLEVRETDCWTDYMFHLDRRRRLGKTGIQHLLRDLRRVAKIDNPITPHCLRHWGASHLHRNGESLLTIRDLLTHASVRQTESYLYADSLQVSRAVQRFRPPALTPVTEQASSSKAPLDSGTSGPLKPPGTASRHAYL